MRVFVSKSREAVSGQRMLGNGVASTRIVDSPKPKRRKKKSSVSRVKSSTKRLTIDELESTGWMAADVEKFNSYAKRMNDLFGVIDVLAVNPLTKEVIGVQATSRENVSARVAKICESPKAAKWLQAGCRLEVWGWDKWKGNCRVVRRVFYVTLSGKAKVRQSAA